MTVTVPKFHQLMWPTLRALGAMGGSASNDELLSKVIELEAITEDIQRVPHTDGRVSELEYRLAWARTYLKTVGAIENSSRGIWAITDKGEKLTEADVQSIRAEVRKIRRARRAADGDERAQGSETDDDNGIDADDWKNRLLVALYGMTSDAFERLTQRILREAGFIKIQVTGRSGDGGIDGVGVLRVNLLSFQVSFQCKKYRGSVGAGAVRDFRGAMIGRSDKGIFITTGSFTADAKREAIRDGAPAIDLIDGDQLCELLKRLNLGVRTETVERVTVDPDWFKIV